MKQEKIKDLYFFNKKSEARLIKVTTSKNKNKKMIFFIHKSSSLNLPNSTVPSE